MLVFASVIFTAVNSRFASAGTWSLILQQAAIIAGPGDRPDLIIP
ncbi:MAG: hypothetical protein R2734_15575 [Nocardioides sp.]